MIFYCNSKELNQFLFQQNAGRLTCIDSLLKMGNKELPISTDTGELLNFSIDIDRRQLNILWNMVSYIEEQTIHLTVTSRLFLKSVMI